MRGTTLGGLAIVVIVLKGDGQPCLVFLRILAIQPVQRLAPSRQSTCPNSASI